MVRKKIWPFHTIIVKTKKYLQAHIVIIFTSKKANNTSKNANKVNDEHIISRKIMDHIISYTLDNEKVCIKPRKLNF